MNEARTIIETLNIPDSMVTEFKTKEEFVKAYSGHWFGFSNEKLGDVYSLVSSKYQTDVSETKKGK